MTQDGPFPFERPLSRRPNTLTDYQTGDNSKRARAPPVNFLSNSKLHGRYTTQTFLAKKKNFPLFHIGLCNVSLSSFPSAGRMLDQGRPFLLFFWLLRLLDKAHIEESKVGIVAKLETPALVQTCDI